MKSKASRFLFAAPIFFSLWSHAAAEDITKANNPDDLNLGSSWALGTAPGAGDFALWNDTVLGTNSTLLGANLSWGGIRITNPGGAVTIGAGNTLTLGTGGIDMSGASQGLTIGSLASLTNTAQTWNAGNQALNVTSFTRATGSTVNMVTSGGGSINIASGTASAALGGYAVLNSSHYAALDASKNVVAATYADYALGGNLSGTYSGILNITGTTTGATQAWRNSNSLTVASGVRFGVNNAQNTKWTVDTSSSGRLLTTPSILVGSAVNQNIEFNGAGGVRASSSGGELILQNFGSGNLIFNTTINGNGASSLTKSGTGTVTIASASGYTGVTRINEGTLQLGNGGAAGSVGSTSIINSGNLEFNRTDSVTAGYAISGNGSVTQSGSGTLSLTGTNTYTGATRFNAGTVSFNSLSNFGNGTVLSFNGGALSWNAVTTDISTRTVTIAAGGATLNTNGNDVTLANSIGNGGAGGLTKAGAGTLTLNGTSYTGATTVTGGTLVTNGSVAGGATVSIGGILSGTATYSGTINVNAGGIIAPGNSVGTITTAGLTLASGSILNFEFNTTPANDYINVTNSGGLTINGGGFNLFQEGTTNAFSTVGSYNLIGYTGSIGGAGTSSLAVLNPQAGKSYGFGATGSNVTLDISAAGVISDWNVDADGSWNTSGNWTSAVPNGVGETVNFIKPLTAARTVTLDGTKTIGGMAINGGVSPLGYTVAQGTSGFLALDNGANQVSIIVTSGGNTISSDVSIDSATAVAAVAADASLTVSGSIGGVGGLVKSGAGTVDLTNVANGYDGGTTLAGGTLGFSALGSLGDGDLSFDGGTLRYNAGNTADISAKVVTLAINGGVIDTNGNDVTLANAIGNGGAGALTKAGSGTLTLQGANSHTGPTSVTGGTLSISSNGNLGNEASGSGLVLNGGTLATTATLAMDNAGANARALTVGAAGAGINVAATTTLTVSGSVTGSAGTLTKSGDGTLVLSGNNSTTLSSAINVTSGTLQAGGTQANGTLGLGTGAITLGNGTTLSSNGVGETDNNTSYGNLTNSISVASGNTATLALAKRITVSSTLTGAGTLKVGIDGTRQEFQGNWSGFSGPINLTGAGEFRIANFQSNVFNNAKLDIGAGVSVHQIFNPPNSGNFTTVQNIGELSGAAGSSLGGNPVGGRFVEWSVGGLDTDSTFSGSIVDSTGAAKLAKVGSGSLTLDGASTYTGTTTVSAGTLLVNGSLGNTAVSVSAATGTATLAGGGSIGSGTASVVIGNNGFLAPGNSAGTMTINGSTTFNAGSTYAYQYTGGASVADLVDVNGALSIGGGSILTLQDLGVYTVGQKFTLFAYDSLSGAFDNFADDQNYTFNGGEWVFNYDDADAGVNGGIGNAFVTITAVPEPAAALLGAMGLLAILRRRR
jgi:autotransporter-associated beta strand protein